MKYFLSRLTPHLTFLIFDLLMVIAHSAGFKGQIQKKKKKKVISPPIQLSSATWFQSVL